MARKSKARKAPIKMARASKTPKSFRVGKAPRKIARGASSRMFPTAKRDGDAYVVPQHSLVSVFDAAGKELESIPLNSSRAAYAEARQLADIFSRASGSRIVRDDGPSGTVFIVGDRSVSVVAVGATGAARRLNPARKNSAPRKNSAARAPRLRPNPLNGAIRKKNGAAPRKNHHLAVGSRVSLGGLRGRVVKSLPGDKYIVQFDDGGREVVAGFKMAIG